MLVDCLLIIRKASVSSISAGVRSGDRDLKEKGKRNKNGGESNLHLERSKW